MISGKLGAFDRIQAPRNSDLSNTILQQEEMNYRYNQDKSKNAEKQRQNQIRLSKERAKLNTGDKTQYINYEHALTDLLNRKGGLIDRYTQAQAAFEIDPTNSRALAIKQNIMKQIQKIALTKKTMLGYHNELRTGIANGKYSKDLNKGFISGMKKINEGGVFFDLDDNGNVSINLSKDVDLDGDGLPDEITMESLMDKNNFGIWESDFNKNELFSAFNKKYKDFENSTENNFVTETTKGLNPEHELLIKDDLRKILGSNANSLTNQGKSFLYQQGYTPKQVRETEGLYDKIISDTANEYKTLRKSKYKKDIDYTQRRLATQPKPNDDNNSNSDFKNIKPIRQENGTTVFGGFKPVKVIDKNGNDIQIENIKVDSNGKFTYDAIDLNIQNKIVKADDNKKEELKSDLRIEGDDDYVFDKFLAALKIKDKDGLYQYMMQQTNAKSETKKIEPNKNLILDNVPDGGF